MQRAKIVEDYLNSVVPKNISDSTKTEILAEIECHIYDKAEFYIEIGYDEETAFQRAVDEMGESEDVREEFNAIYKDSNLMAGICAVGILICNLIALFTGFPYFLIDTLSEPSAFIVLLSSLFTSAVLLVIFHARNNKYYNRLFAIGVATALMVFFALISNAIYQPVFYGIGYNIAWFIYKLNGKYLNEIPQALAMLGSWLFMFVIIFLCAKKPKKSHNLKVVAIVFLILSILNTLGYYKLEMHPEDTTAEYIEEIVEAYYPYYSEIKDDMTFEQADKYLRENGFGGSKEFIAYNKTIDETYGEDFYYSNAIDDVEDLISKHLEGKNGEIYLTKEDSEVSYIDCCIILSKDMKTRLVILDSHYSLIESQTIKANKARENFLSLTLGDNKTDIDKLIDTMGFKVFEKSYIQNGKEITEYELEFESREEIPSWKNFFGVTYMEHCTIDTYIQFTDGKLTDGTMEYDLYNFKTEYSENQIYTLDDE